MQQAFYDNSILNLSNCTICPRKCGVDRTNGALGFCRQPATFTLARAALHFWEEPCLSGTSGSGAIFFSGCNMQCVFCQNHEIALSNHGKSISAERFVQICFELQEKGANNINLVTPTHFVPLIIPALQQAKRQGLALPIVYNSSGYESVDTLRCLEGLVDIYLPDLKYCNSDLSATLSKAPDYFQVATKAIQEMVRQVGTPKIDERTGLMQSGVIVRHLCLPEQSKDTKKILRYLYTTYGNQIYLSIMNQYTPMPQIKNVTELSYLHHPVSDAQYEKIIQFAIALGIENAFIQEGETQSDSFVPDFSLEGV